MINDNRRILPDVPARQRQPSMPAAQQSVPSALPAVTVPGMAYVPFQTETETYAPCRALSAGTLFPCLDKPFLGGKCR